MNVKTELLPLLVIIDLPYGKLVKTMMFNIFQENIPLMVNIKNHVFLCTTVQYQIMGNLSIEGHIMEIVWTFIGNRYTMDLVAQLPIS